MNPWHLNYLYERENRGYQQVLPDSLDNGSAHHCLKEEIRSSKKSTPSECLKDTILLSVSRWLNKTKASSKIFTEKLS